MKRLVLAVALMLGFTAVKPAAGVVVLRQLDSAGGEYLKIRESDATISVVEDKGNATPFTTQVAHDNPTLASLYLWDEARGEFWHLEYDERDGLMLIPHESILMPEVGSPWTWTIDGGSLISFGEEPLIQLVVEEPPCFDGRVLRDMGDGSRE